jgi:N-acetylgalactosamine kinase
MSDNDIMCVVLAAGEGKRMRSLGGHKSCVSVAGRPVIVRLIETLVSAGLARVMVVVGSKAEQVQAAAASAAGAQVAFVTQSKRLGTGHAAACAAAGLREMGFAGDVLVTMGDKVIAPAVLTALIALHRRAQAAMTLAALPNTPGNDAGRIVTGAGGVVLGVVEAADIRSADQKGESIRLAGKEFAAEVIDLMPTVNASLYIFSGEAFQESVAALGNANVQGEFYLTDAVEHLNRVGKKVAVLNVADPEDLMAFNTPEELADIERVLARRARGGAAADDSGEAPAGARAAGVDGGAARAFPGVRPAGQWLKIVRENPPALASAMRDIYGDDETLLAERRKAYATVLHAFVLAHGEDRPAVLARAPGRVNLMGRHVDHRGGMVNAMAIDREVVLAAGLREDDAVTITNIDQEHFPHRKFGINRLLGLPPYEPWLDVVAAAERTRREAGSHPDWVNYFKGAVLRVRHAHPDVAMRGMDCVLSGDIPISAGLSSSSALVVVGAEAFAAVNGVAIDAPQLIELCAEGEWYIGSRGGSADHAAIRAGRRGQVAAIGFFPFAIHGYVEIPADLAVMVADSRIPAAKGGPAKDAFNQRVACYEIAEMLLTRQKAVAGKIHHLRDVQPERLKKPLAGVYRLLASLPVAVSRSQAVRLLPERIADLEGLFATHEDVGPYRLREVALFGISECARSERFAAMLAGGELEMVGQFMRVSHDGDRVVRWQGGKCIKHVPSYNDSRMEQLVRLASADDPRVSRPAELWAQSGRYACSTPELDDIVDIAIACSGVIGAQICGAGLGGAAMILLRAGAVGEVAAALTKHYYEPSGLSSDCHVCRPIGGSGVLNV